MHLESIKKINLIMKALTNTKIVWLFIICVIIVAAMTSCSGSTSNDQIDEIDLMIDEVRELTQNLRTRESAAEAGWIADLSGCVEHPTEGGMGHHIARPEFIDGRINHLQPQALLFEPLDGGGAVLVGVEYIIPFEILSETEDAPELFDRPYRQNHEQGIWALHVWTEKENPKGMFSDWNPNVSCQYAIDDTELMLEEVREVTSDYTDINAAMDAGWETALSPCVEHPEFGGMGYHYGRMEFMDGRAVHTEPQVLLYEPLENGALEFVGVEYIIPFEIHPETADAPQLFGQPYHQNNEQGFWALHVWTEKENPAGIFNDFNSEVSCQFATELN